MKKIFKALTCVVISAFLCCASLGCSNKGEYDDTLRVGTLAKFTNANRSEYDFDVISGTLSQLAPVALNGDGSFSPLLTDWTTSENGLVWTFTVRDNMSWHDGVAVTAEDVLFTFNYTDAVEGANWLKDAVGTDLSVTPKRFLSAEVSVDKRSVSITLASPMPRLLNGLTALRVMPKHVYANGAGYKLAAEVTDAQSRIGCGPYAFDSFDKNAATVKFTHYEAYPDYSSSVKKVIIKTYSEDTIYLAMATGEIDIIYNYSGGVPAAYAQYLSRNQSLKVTSLPSTALPAVLGFNTDGAANTSDAKELVKNVKFREAVRWALDYDNIKSLFGTNYATSPNSGIVPVGSVGYATTQALSRDVAKPEGLLREMGATRNVGDEYYSLGGKTVEFNVIYRTNKAVNARIIEVITSNLKDVGIKVTSTPYAVLGDYQTALWSRDYDSILFGATAYGMSGGQGLGTTYFDGNNSTQGISQIKTSEFSTIISALSSAKNSDEYAAAASACQAYYASYAPAIALYYDGSLQVYSRALEGFHVDASFGLLNVQTFKTLTKTK